MEGGLAKRHGGKAHKVYKISATLEIRQGIDSRAWSWAAVQIALCNAHCTTCLHSIPKGVQPGSRALCAIWTGQNLVTFPPHPGGAYFVRETMAAWQAHRFPERVPARCRARKNSIACSFQGMVPFLFGVQMVVERATWFQNCQWKALRHYGLQVPRSATC